MRFVCDRARTEVTTNKVQIPVDQWAETLESRIILVISDLNYFTSGHDVERRGLYLEFKGWFSRTALILPCVLALLAPE